MRAGRSKVCALLLGVLVALGVAGCAKRNVPVAGGGSAAGADYGRGSGLDEAKWREMGLMTEAERQQFLQKAQEFENQDIFFAYDAYALTDEAKGILNAKAEFIRRYAKVKVTIEGHCDERGTNEYNLALGERRAHAAQQYLANLGVSTGNLNTISYGEERPLAAGSGEGAWARNRRAHFVLDY